MTSPTPPDGAALPEIHLSSDDHARLSRLVGDHETHGVAALLQQELERAVIWSGAEAPHDAVALNRWVHFTDGRAQGPRRIKIVMPGEADIDAGLVSALSHVGAGLIGVREGDTILWPDPSGAARRLTPMRIERPGTPA